MKILTMYESDDARIRVKCEPVHGEYSKLAYVRLFVGRLDEEPKNINHKDIKTVIELLNAAIEAYEV